MTNGIIVAEDGVEALKYFFGEDGKSGCANEECPVVILLDLKLPRVDGLEVLRRLRADAKTKRIPVVVLTSSMKKRISLPATTWAPTASCANRSSSPNSPKQSGNSGYTGLFSTSRHRIARGNRTSYNKNPSFI